MGKQLSPSSAPDTTKLEDLPAIPQPSVQLLAKAGVHTVGELRTSVASQLAEFLRESGGQGADFDAGLFVHLMQETVDPNYKRQSAPPEPIADDDAWTCQVKPQNISEPEIEQPPAEQLPTLVIESPEPTVEDPKALRLRERLEATLEEIERLDAEHQEHTRNAKYQATVAHQLAERAEHLASERKKILVRLESAKGSQQTHQERRDTTGEELAALRDQAAELRRQLKS